MSECPPGSIPHIPNWSPAETPEEYLSNCREGLEKFTETRFAALTGMTRIQIWRCRAVAEIPEELLERLLRCGKRAPSTKMLAGVGQWFRGGSPAQQVERCPHCGEITRLRQPWSKAIQETVFTWLKERENSTERIDHGKEADED